MYTINNNIEKRIEVKKSKFIAKLYHVDNLDDVNQILNELKEKYHDASHIVYAYIIDNKIYKTDDGEPANSAGSPILDILTQNQMNHILGVIIRYFGGTKLGLGPLTRTYSTLMKDALSSTNKCVVKESFQIEIYANYKNNDKLNYLLKTNNIKIDKIDYDINIIYQINISKDKLNILDNYQYKIIKESTILEEI